MCECFLKCVVKWLSCDKLCVSAANRRAGSKSGPIMNGCDWGVKVMMHVTLTQEAPVGGTEEFCDFTHSLHVYSRTVPSTIQ